MLFIVHRPLPQISPLVGKSGPRVPSQEKLRKLERQLNDKGCSTFQVLVFFQLPDAELMHVSANDRSFGIDRTEALSLSEERYEVRLH